MPTSPRDLLTGRSRGALVTLKRDGRPQLSNVDYTVDAAGTTVRISTTGDRAKVANLRRDPRASLYVTVDGLGAYAVAEGVAHLSPEATAPDDATVTELVEVYRLIRGEHPDWDDYRAAMVADRRLVLTVRVSRVYGYVPSG